MCNVDNFVHNRCDNSGFYRLFIEQFPIALEAAPNQADMATA